MLECNIPILLPENHRVFQLWQILNKFDRTSGFSGIESISSARIRNFCFDYDETWETYEKILSIEGEFVTRWREQQKKKEERQQK